MKKNILSLLILIASVCSYSQIKDTIKLEEIKILASNKKVEHLKTKGKLSSLTGNPIKGIISKVDEIPDGNLSSIKFFFNNSPIFFIKDKEKANYRDVELGLLIYNVNDNGTPGELLIDKVIVFTLNSKNKGNVELNLKPLYINTSKTMFFGIELLKKQIGKDFKIMTKCNDKNSKLLYCKTWNSEKWYYSEIPCEMKLDIGITSLAFHRHLPLSSPSWPSSPLCCPCVSSCSF